MVRRKEGKEKEDLPVFDSIGELPHIPVSVGIKGSIGKTGEWRTFKPVIVVENCNKCGFCYLYCPEGTIHFTKEGGPEIDLVYCKGCGICAHECPKEAIEMKMENDEDS